MVSDFLNALYLEQSGLLELRPLPYRPDCRLWAAVENGQIDIATVDRFVALSGQHGFNAYFGVAMRAERNQPGQAPVYATLPALFVDLDFAHSDEQQARACLARFAFQPSIVVHSGNGLHAYWLLTESLECSTPEAWALTSAILERFNGAFSVADRGVKDAARILRLPGTMNRKRLPARQVTIERLDADRRYAVVDLLTQCPWATDGSDFMPAKPFKVTDVGAGEGRHEMLYKLGRSVLARGVPLDGAIAVCLVENERLCQPPLTRGEAESYLRRVLSYADRIGFERATTLSGLDVVGALLEIGVSFAAARLAGLCLDPKLDEVLS